MIYRRQLLLIFAFLTIGFTYPQNSNREISEETTQKKYEMYEDGKLVKKSVKIHTSISQEIKFAKEDEGKIDARRIISPKTIVKTINIDNDIDDDYDEVISFSYTSDANKDFVFGTNDNEIFAAIENSKYLNIHNDAVMSEENLNTMFVITNKEGKVLQLILEDHKSMK